MNVWLATIATLAIQAVGTFSVITVPVTVPAGGDALRMDPVLLGAFTAVVYFGAMVSGLASARHITRIGSIRMSQLCLLSAACGLMLVEAGTAFALVGALFIGMGYGPLTPTSSEILSRATPRERRNFVFSIKQTGVPIGGAAAGALLPFAIEAGGWRAGPACGAIACLVIAAAVEPARRSLDLSGIVPPPLSGRARLHAFVDPLRMMMADPVLRRLGLTAFCLAAVQLAMTTHMVSFLGRGLGLALPVAGSMLAALQVSGICGRLAGGWFADRLGNAGTVLSIQAAIIVLTAAGFSLVALTMRDDAATRTVLLLLSIAFGATALGWNGTLIAELTSSSPPGREAAATAGMMAFTSFGGITGGFAFGVCAQSPWGYPGAFGAMALPAALSLLMMLSLRRRSASAPGAGTA